MGNLLGYQETINQSWTAYNQHKDNWRRHAMVTKELGTKSLSDLDGIGVGKTMVLVAMGASLEKQIGLLKQHRDKIDIFCCDKALGVLIEHDIIPDFCLVADANVDFEKYGRPYIEKTGKTKLIQNVCANPDWIKYWRGESFAFVNKDSIGSEKEFCALSGINNIIVASSNVSNAMIVICTQSTEFGRKNAFGYDQYLLVGYDYSWGVNGSYYAFDYNAGEKRFYMNHMLKSDINGNPCYTSGNLFFSVRWLYSYITLFRLPVFNCSGEGLYPVNLKDFKEALEEIELNPKRLYRLQNLFKEKIKTLKLLKTIDTELSQLA